MQADAIETRSLRSLYIVRAVFQVIWAAAVITMASSQPALVAVLFVLYPLWDVACTIYDLKTSTRTGSTHTSQTINALLGVAAAVGIALTVAHRPTYAVAIFGAWALVAGALQLLAGTLRRKQELGGQWAMILSGAQSAVAGVLFLAGGLADKKHIRDVGGYACFGAFYFLISAVLLSRKLKSLPTSEAH